MPQSFWFIGNRRDQPPYLAVRRNAKLISHYIWRYVTANPREPSFFCPILKYRLHGFFTHSFILCHLVDRPMSWASFKLNIQTWRISLAKGQLWCNLRELSITVDFRDSVSYNVIENGTSSRKYHLFAKTCIWQTIQLKNRKNWQNYS